MMHRSLLLAATAATLLAAGCGMQPGATPNTRDGQLAAQATTGRLLVKYAPAATRAARMQLTTKFGLKSVTELPQVDMAVYQPAGDARKVLAELKQAPGVLWAELDGIEKLPPVTAGRVVSGSSRGFNDPMMGQQWSIGKVNAEEAWKITTGDAKTVVAVVDTGIDYSHPDLAGRVIKGYDFANKDEDPMDDQGHGTHCAGIVGATAGNGVGIAGMAPGVSLMAVKVLSGNGSGTTADVVSGILYAVDHGAKVVSMSLGGSGGQQTKQEAIDYCLAHDVLPVVAMGNNGGEVTVYPAACKGAMAVGATTSDDTRASFSNFGNWISVSSPGKDIMSTFPGGGYKSLSGTSMATPLVAGLAGLVRSQHPDWKLEQVKAKIEQSADDLGTQGFDKEFGHGRVNAAAALR